MADLGGAVGTFACPICGFDQPHTHEASIVAQRNTLDENQRAALRHQAEAEHRLAQLRAECEANPRAYVNKYGSINSPESAPLIPWLLAIIENQRAELSRMSAKTIELAAKLRLATGRVSIATRDAQTGGSRTEAPSNETDPREAQALRAAVARQAESVPDTEDDDPSNMNVRSGYLRGLASRRDDRDVLRRAARSLAYASAQRPTKESS